MVVVGWAVVPLSAPSPVSHKGNSWEPGRLVIEAGSTPGSWIRNDGGKFLLRIWLWEAGRRALTGLVCVSEDKQVLSEAGAEKEGEGMGHGTDEDEEGGMLCKCSSVGREALF